MDIIIKFTKEELALLSRALTFGIIHTESDSESNTMKALEEKINFLMRI